MTSDTRDILTIGTCLVELTPEDSGKSITEARTLHKLATGAAALFACALARLGVRAALLSAVGEDELGEFVITELGSMGVDPSHIFRAPNQLTSVSFASADGKGGKTFRFYRFPGYSDPLAMLDSSHIRDNVLSESRLFDFTESCIRSEGLLRESAFDLARRSRRLGVEVCYAPNWRPILWPCDIGRAREVQQEAVRLCDILLLNGEEARLIADCSDLRDAAAILGSLGPHTVVITGGGEGPTLVCTRSEIHEVHPYPVPVHYDVGAGDTFHAAFLAAHLWGYSAADAAHFAAATAALKITRSPALRDLPSRKEVETFLTASRQPNFRPVGGPHNHPQDREEQEDPAG